MKRKQILKSFFFTLLISTISSSCGLVEKYKSSDQPTDANPPAAAVSERPETVEATTDDLFSQAMNDSKESSAEPSKSATDAPSNITTHDSLPKDDLLAMDNNLEAQPKNENSKNIKVEESYPQIKSDLTEISESNNNSDAGSILIYKMQKGETLMQIAFKIYGDVSKWKELKQMNSLKLSKNSNPKSELELKYKAPSKVFTWNPEGTPYLIKNGETLGTISKTVYQTSRKWKKIWNNNKPLIKNPNIIYSGFTIYYKKAEVANLIQPKVVQRKLATKVKDNIDESGTEDEVLVH